MNAQGFRDARKLTLAVLFSLGIGTGRSVLSKLTLAVLLSLYWDGSKCLVKVDPSCAFVFVLGRVEVSVLCENCQS